MKAMNDLIKRIIREKGLGSPNQLAETVLRDATIKAFLTKHQANLSAAQITASLPVLYEFYSQKQQPNPVIAGYEPQLFFADSVIQIKYLKTAKQLAAEQESQVKRNVQLVNLPLKLRQVNLYNLDRTPDRLTALTKVSQFLAAYQQGQPSKGVYLSGDFGVGKTYILAGLANAVAKLGKRVVFLHVPTFIASLASHFADNSLQTEIKRVAETDILILDDIGAETLSQWSRDDVLGVILQVRMDNSLPTFFSSNLDLTSLESHFAETKDAIDPVKAARLMARVRFLAEEVVVSGPNRRN